MNIISSNRVSNGFIVILAVLLAQFAYTQEDDAFSSATYNFRKGLWALQFRIDHNFTLSSFQGGTISAKVHTSDKSAIRFGLSVSGEYHKDEEQENALLIYDPDMKYHQESLTFDLQYIRYPSADKQAKFFYGFGPLITGSHQSTILPSSSRIYSIGVGLTVVLGAEYIVSPHLGLTAEYGTIVKYVRNYSRYNSVGYPYKYIGEDIIVDTNAVKFGVSVYL
ncbi:hypothetical protein JW824_09610 [bacterium]|nr:hypothetical protein [bacterium]RQV94346.1 MAG: hypothetical protein EH221_07810 [bacterium]